MSILKSKRHLALPSGQQRIIGKGPDEIRRSTQDERVHLYYKSIGRVSVCVVADHFTEKEGYLITTYLTDRIKEGEQIYVKN